MALASDKETSDRGNALERPFFLQRDEWIEPPDDWSKNIVSGKTYVLAERSDLWEAIKVRLVGLSPAMAESDADEIFTESWVRQRLGQGSFRTLVTQTYERRWAVTHEKILPILQAAHIRPVTAGGQHRIENGLLLRSDIHTLFDRGYLTVDSDHRLRVSLSLRDEFDNGKYYLSMSGAEIFFPSRTEHRPDGDLLEWHRDTVFRG